MVFPMPTRSPRGCNCENKTKPNNSPTDHDRNQTDNLNDVVTVVAAAVGFIALLTIIVSVWLIRRRYLNKKARCHSSFDLSDETDDVSKSTNLERTRMFSVTRIDMYGGSLKDLRRKSEEEEVRHIVNRGLHSAYSHTFLHRGDHNNTILNTLSTTWSIQTLPNPCHPGGIELAKVTDNPIYARPVNVPKRSASSNALYESADNIRSKTMEFRKDFEPRPESPVYERIIEFQKYPRANVQDRHTK